MPSGVLWPSDPEMRGCRDGRQLAEDDCSPEEADAIDAKAEQWRRRST